MTQSITCNPEYVERIKKYLAEKEEWQRNVPEEIVPGSVRYEAFLGDRGEAVLKSKKRIAMGILKAGEQEATKKKSLGDAAFRAGHFQKAANHYTTAVEVWGNPHNAVCYSNLAAAFLKLQKWEEAEMACQQALWEHLSIHGEHYGIFHIKVFHRLGLAYVGLGRYEVAETYLEKALKINPNNSAVKSDLKETTQNHLVASNASQAEQQERWKSTFGLTEPEIEHILQAGGKPWDEDVQDLLEVGGLRPDTLNPLGSQHAFPSTDKLQDSAFKAGCSYCYRGSTNMPLWTCRGCGTTAYCSQRCAVRNFESHVTFCMHMGNRENIKKLPMMRRDDIVVSQRVRRFAYANLRELQKLLTVVLEMLGPEDVVDRTAYEHFVCVVDLAYEVDPSKPLQILGVRKVALEEKEPTVPKMADLCSHLEEGNRKERARGMEGVSAVIVLVQDGEWHYSDLHTFVMPKGVFNTAGPAPEEGWVQRWVDEMNALERSRYD